MLDIQCNFKVFYLNFKEIETRLTFVNDDYPWMHVFGVEHINRLKATVFKSIIIYFNQLVIDTI